MLHKILEDYCQRVEAAFSVFETAYIEKYEEEVLTPERVNLRIRARFLSGHLLEINQAVIFEAENLMTLDYRYHFQDGNHHLVLRYDSTPHFPELPTFPHHKHCVESVIACEKPDLLEVLLEVNEWLNTQ